MATSWNLPGVAVGTSGERAGDAIRLAEGFEIGCNYSGMAVDAVQHWCVQKWAMCSLEVRPLVVLLGLTRGDEWNSVSNGRWPEWGRND